MRISRTRLFPEVTRAFAHLVRDKEMSDALIASMLAHGVYAMPNIGAPERGIHTAPPPWFEEPYLSGTRVPVDPGAPADETAAMTGWTPNISQMTIMGVGVVQGIGLGFIFVPLSVVTLSTLSPDLRAEGAGLYSLSRNIGSSVGISVVNSLLTTNTQVNHAEIVQHVTAVNRRQLWPDTRGRRAGGRGQSPSR